MSEKEKDNILTGRPRADDPIDNALRPTRLDELIGQNNVKENLIIQIKAARQRGEPVEHSLFYGPPGLGKTTLAHI